MSSGGFKFNKFQAEFLPSVSWGQWCLLFIFVGLSLRLYGFFTAGSLFVDEAMTILNLQSRNYLELLSPLDYKQISPIGWLYLHKFVITIWPNVEALFRLPTLVFGIATIGVIFLVGKRHLDQAGAFMAVALISVLPYAMSYSVTARPYSTDILFSAIVLMSTLDLLARERITFGNVAFLAISGLLGILFSFPIVIVLASSGIAILLKVYIRQSWQDLPPVILMGVAWLALFLFFYLNFYNQPSEVVDWMKGEAWDTSFAPNPFGSLFALQWYPSNVQNVFAYLFTDEGSFLAIAFVGAGVTGLCVDKRFEIALLVAAPLALALFLSVLKIYPFDSRLVVFLMPSFIVAIAYGFSFLMKLSGEPKVAPVLLGMVLVIAVLWRAFSFTFEQGLLGQNEDIRPAMEMLSEDAQKTDLLYVGSGAMPSFWYYRDRFEGIRDLDVMYGRDPLASKDCMYLDLKELAGRGRVWILFAHILRNRGEDGEGFFIHQAGRIGDVLVDYAPRRTRLVLVDFNRPKEGLDLEPSEELGGRGCYRYWSTPIPE